MSRHGVRDAGRAVRVVHPAPSFIVATAVAVLAAIGEASAAEVVTLAVAMLGFQFSIGALNDIADADADRLAAAHKPIPSGIVSTRGAAVIAGSGALVGVGLSSSFGPVVVLLGVAGWGCGATYDLGLRRAGLGWLAFAAALPLLLAYTWTATGAFPAGWPALLLVAAVAGPMLHLANSLVDPQTDARTSRRTLATTLGHRRARITLSLLVLLVLGLAVLAIASQGPVAPARSAAFLLGAAIVLVGVALGWASTPRWREAGWLLLASGMIPIVAAWVTS